MRESRCSECRAAPAAGGVMCDLCRAAVLRLRALHAEFAAARPAADRHGHRLRVELYAAVVALGGRLFERAEP